MQRNALNLIQETQKKVKRVKVTCAYTGKYICTHPLGFVHRALNPKLQALEQETQEEVEGVKATCAFLENKALPLLFV